MENAEAVVDGGKRIDVVLQPIRGLRLDHKENPGRPQQRAYLGECAFGRREVVHTVASHDQVEPAIRLIVLRGLRKEVDAVTNTGSFGRMTRLPNGLSIRIKADDLALGKGLGDGNPDPSDPASNIQYPTALLKSRCHIRQLC